MFSAQGYDALRHRPGLHSPHRPGCPPSGWRRPRHVAAGAGYQRCPVAAARSSGLQRLPDAAGTDDHGPLGGGHRPRAAARRAGAARGVAGRATGRPDLRRGRPGHRRERRDALCAPAGPGRARRGAARSRCCREAGCWCRTTSTGCPAWSPTARWTRCWPTTASTTTELGARSGPRHARCGAHRGRRAALPRRHDRGHDSARSRASRIAPSRSPKAATSARRSSSASPRAGADAWRASSWA